MATEQYRRSDLKGQDYIDKDIDTCESCGRELVNKKGKLVCTTCERKKEQRPRHQKEAWQ